MSVSALTNSFYNYVPVTSSQYETSSNKNVSNTQTQENIKATDEKQTQNQIISNSYEENNKNTLSNNSDDNKNISYFTGQEILASGGSYVKGGASYDYQTGPDGKQYAVGGSVNIDTSPVADDPEATIAKAQVVIKAALAPADPSSQDQKVASEARQMMNDARKELNSQKNTEISSKENTENTTASINENESKKTTVNIDENTYSSASANVSSKENMEKTNTDNNMAAAQTPVQNTKESSITSVKQKNNQIITASSYNTGSIISLTA